jgi:hypothetical protein
MSVYCGGRTHTAPALAAAGQPDRPPRPPHAHAQRGRTGARPWRRHARGGARRARQQRRRARPAHVGWSRGRRRRGGPLLVAAGAARAGRAAPRPHGVAAGQLHGGRGGRGWPREPGADVGGPLPAGEAPELWAAGAARAAACRVCLSGSCRLDLWQLLHACQTLKKSRSPCSDPFPWPGGVYRSAAAAAQPGETRAPARPPLHGPQMHATLSRRCQRAHCASAYAKP